MKPACLPFKFEKFDFTGEYLTLVGWGHTQRKFLNLINLVTQ